MPYVEYGCEYNLIKLATPPGNVNGDDCRTFEMDFPLINGRRTTVTLKAVPQGGGLRPIYLLTEPDLLEEDVEDLASFRWFVFPKDTHYNLSMPSLLLWEDFGEYLVAACSSGRGEKWMPFTKQLKAMTQELGNRDYLTQLCPWPDPRVQEQIISEYRKLNEQRGRGKRNYSELEFCTFRKQFEQGVFDAIDIADRGRAFARYVREIRTMLAALCSMDEEMGVAINNEGSMDVFYKEEHPCQTAFVRDGRPRHAHITYLNHAPAIVSAVDCVGLVITSGEELTVRAYYWPNPLLGTQALEEILFEIMGTAGRYGVPEENVHFRGGFLPFESVTGTDLSLSMKDNL